MSKLKINYAEVARRLGWSRQRLAARLKSKKPIPIELALWIEKESQGLLTAKELRPDLADVAKSIVGSAL